MIKNEKDILLEWEEVKEIYFWGGCQRSITLAEKICNTFPKLKIAGVIDNYIKENYVLIKGKEVPVYTWKQKCKNTYIILCIPRESTYAQIRRTLMNSGFRYGENYIDGYAIIDEYNDITFGTNEFPYDNVGIGTRYAPWRMDGKFSEAYNLIKENTLVDIYRCYELWELVCQSAKCSEGELLEVGVWRGGTGALIAKAAIESDILQTVSLCDTFEGVVKCSEKDNFYRGKEHADTSVIIVEELLQKLELNNAYIYKGVFPEDNRDHFADKKYRFVHIDVDVYQSAKDIFEFVWKNVVQGGIVVFDDYGFLTTQGVTRLLNNLKMTVKDARFGMNINGHGYFIKI